MSKIAETIKNARKLIETNGWFKKQHTNTNHCILTALCNVGSGYDPTLSTFIRKRLPEGFKTIIGFNDDPSTSKEDMFNFMDKCIAEAEELNV